MPVQDNEILRVTIQATLDDGSIVQNRKTFECDFADTQSDSAVLAAVDTWVETLYAYVASQIDADAELDQGTVDVIEWNPTLEIWEVARNVGVYSPLDTFAGTTDPIPNQCAAFVVGNTIRPKSKGRIFVFPFTETEQNHGVLISTALTALGNFAAHYILSQGVTTGNVLLSGIVREAANQFYEFLSAEYGDVIGTQRRRRVGIGI